MIHIGHYPDPIRWGKRVWFRRQFLSLRARRRSHRAKILWWALWSSERISLFRRVSGSWWQVGKIWVDGALSSRRIDVSDVPVILRPSSIHMTLKPCKGLTSFRCKNAFRSSKRKELPTEIVCAVSPAQNWPSGLRQMALRTAWRSSAIILDWDKQLLTLCVN